MVEGLLAKLKLLAEEEDDKDNEENEKFDDEEEERVKQVKDWDDDDDNYDNEWQLKGKGWNNIITVRPIQQ